MATTLSSFTRSQTSSPVTRNQPGNRVTPAMQKLGPGRQLTPRVVFRLPNEPEDARITGGTRSLDRRLLGLNLAGTRSGANAA